MHTLYMGSGTIATVTAFVVTALDGGVFAWLMPTVVGTALLTWNLRGVRTGIDRQCPDHGVTNALTWSGTASEAPLTGLFSSSEDPSSTGVTAMRRTAPPPPASVR